DGVAEAVDEALDLAFGRRRRAVRRALREAVGELRLGLRDLLVARRGRALLAGRADEAARRVEEPLALLAGGLQELRAARRLVLVVQIEPVVHLADDRPDRGIDLGDGGGARQRRVGAVAAFLRRFRLGVAPLVRELRRRGRDRLVTSGGIALRLPLRP